MQLDSFRKHASRVLSLVLVSVILLAGCDADEKADASPTSTAAPDEPPSLADRFTTATESELSRINVMEKSTALRRHQEGVTVGDSPKGSAWKPYAFPHGAVRGTNYLFDVNVPARKGTPLTVSLLELAIPDGVSACEAPWRFEPSDSDSCEVSALSRKAQLVQDRTGSPRFLKASVINDDWVLTITAYGRLNKKNVVITNAPLTKKQHHRLLLRIAKSLDGSIKTSAQSYSRDYTIPGTSVTLSLPMTWDVESGREHALDSPNSAYLFDTTTEGEQLFFDVRPKPPGATDSGLPCEVMASRKVVSPPGREEAWVIETWMEDTRSLVGLVTVGVTPIRRKDVGATCPSLGGVSYRGTRMTLDNSIRFETPEAARAWAQSEGHSELIEILRSVQVGT